MRFALLVLLGCQSRAPAPAPPEQVARGSGGDLERWICEHTSWTTRPETQARSRSDGEREDRELAVRRAKVRHPGDAITPLRVELIDDYAWRPHRGVVANRCDGVPPYHVEVLLDGELRGAIDIPCMDGFRSPARSWELPAFEVAPGVHRIRIREVAHAITGTRDFVFPETDDGSVLGDVAVQCSETRFDIGDLTGPTMRL